MSIFILFSRFSPPAPAFACTNVRKVSWNSAARKGTWRGRLGGRAIEACRGKEAETRKKKKTELFHALRRERDREGGRKRIDRLYLSGIKRKEKYLEGRLLLMYFCGVEGILFSGCFFYLPRASNREMLVLYYFALEWKVWYIIYIYIERDTPRLEIPSCCCASGKLLWGSDCRLCLFFPSGIFPYNTYTARLEKL